MADRDLNIFIRARDFAAGVFSKLGSFLKNSFVITLGDVTRAFRGIASAVKSVISASDEQDDANRRLNAALVSTGQFSESASKKIRDFATELQKTSVHADETIVSAGALIAQLSGLSVEQLPEAIRVTVGLADALRIDLDTAARIAAKAFTGNTVALSRYGLKVREASDATDRYNAVLEALDPLSSQTAARTETLSGRLAQLNNQWGEVLEQVGDIVTQNKGVKDSIADLSKTLGQADVVGAIASLASGFAFLASNTAKALPHIKQFLDLITLPSSAAILALVFGIKKLSGESVTLGEVLVAEKGLFQDAFNSRENLAKAGKDATDAAKAQSQAESDLALKTDTARIAQENAAGAQRRLESERKKALDTTKALTDEASNAANVLGVEIDLSKFQTQATAVKNATDAFTILQKLNERGLVTDREVLAARLAYDKIVSENSIPITGLLDEATKGLDVSLKDTTEATKNAALATDDLRVKADGAQASVRGVGTAASDAAVETRTASEIMSDSIGSGVEAGVRRGLAALRVLSASITSLAQKSGTISAGENITGPQYGPTNPRVGTVYTRVGNTQRTSRFISNLTTQR